MSEFWAAQLEDLKRRAEECRTLKNKLAIVESERNDHARHVSLLQELLKEAEECQATLRDERDNARLQVGEWQEEAANARRERDTAQLNANAMRGNEAANVALVDKYFHENFELQRERDEARKEAAAMRRERDGLQGALDCRRRQADQLSQERDEWKARWEKDVSQSIAWVDQERLRRAEIYAAQNKEERDQARRERDEALKLLDYLWLKIGQFRGRDT